MEIPQLPASAITNVSTNSTTSKDEAAIRQVASEFEALLLNQLTSTLNKTDEEEGGLFSDSGGGLSISHQLFGEQLAKTISQSGGIGLADMIMKQLAGNKTQGPSKLKSLTPHFATETAQITKPGESNVNSVPTSGRFITSEAALATRPRRVHSVQTQATERVAKPAEVFRSIAHKPVDLNPTSHVSLKLPIRGAIRSVFGPRRDPINGRPRFHKGIDIAAPKGTPIQSAAAGTVVFAGRNKGYGNMVLLEHADGRRTLYAHAEALFVQVGDRVAAGETIAAVGSTGHSTGPHVHFEIRVGDQAVNPLSALANDLVASSR